MENNNYNVTVNEQSKFKFDAEQINNFDFVKEQDGHFHILKTTKLLEQKLSMLTFLKRPLLLK